ncbi:MAG: Acyl-CoA dehydrogenase, N-terminal domain, partial [Bacteroidota bacterium]
MASFQESESVQMVRQTVRDFAEKNIRPYLMEWDEAQTFPV